MTCCQIFRSNLSMLQQATGENSSQQSKSAAEVVVVDSPNSVFSSVHLLNPKLRNRSISLEDLNRKRSHSPFLVCSFDISSPNSTPCSFTHHAPEVGTTWAKRKTQSPTFTATLSAESSLDHSFRSIVDDLSPPFSLLLLPIEILGVIVSFVNDHKTLLALSHAGDR